MIDIDIDIDRGTAARHGQMVGHVASSINQSSWPTIVCLPWCRRRHKINCHTCGLVGLIDRTLNCKHLFLTYLTWRLVAVANGWPDTTSLTDTVSPSCRGFSRWHLVHLGPSPYNHIWSCQASSSWVALLFCPWSVVTSVKLMAGGTCCWLDVDDEHQARSLHLGRYTTQRQRSLQSCNELAFGYWRI